MPGCSACWTRPPAVRARADGAAGNGANAASGKSDLPNAAFAPSPTGRAGSAGGDLRVRYGPDEPWALDGLDLDLHPGRRVAVVGPSGAGKSTLAEVLFRFRDPDGGTVHLDGIDVACRDPDDTRRVLSGMPQDPHVFAASLRDNLLLARPGATDDELWDVLRRVRLADDVAVLPDGLGTEVGPQGARLSGGMRGRLALARALLADPEVLVLDEPTTHLDPDTRDAVLDDILAATAGRTVLLVTHDLSHLDRFDEVAVVVGGRVVQRGAHAELIATTAGTARPTTRPARGRHRALTGSFARATRRRPACAGSALRRLPTIGSPVPLAPPRPSPGHCHRHRRCSPSCSPGRAACTSAARRPDAGPDAPTGHWRWTPQADRLQLGVTHTRQSLDPHDPDAARDRGRRDPRGPRRRLAEPPPDGVRHAQPGARPRRVRLGEPRPAHAAHRGDRRPDRC